MCSKIKIEGPTDSTPTKDIYIEMKATIAALEALIYEAQHTTSNEIHEIIRNSFNIVKTVNQLTFQACSYEERHQFKE